MCSAPRAMVEAQLESVPTAATKGKEPQQRKGKLGLKADHILGSVLRELLLTRWSR